MLSNEHGSFLVMTITILFLVTGFTLIGTVFYFNFSGEADALEAQLTAEHLARSGLAMFAVEAVEMDLWISFGTGEFRLEMLDKTPDQCTVKVTTRAKPKPGATAQGIYTGRFKRGSQGWIMIEFNKGGS